MTTFDVNEDLLITLLGGLVYSTEEDVGLINNWKGHVLELNDSAA